MYIILNISKIIEVSKITYLNEQYFYKIHYLIINIVVVSIYHKSSIVDLDKIIFDHHVKIIIDKGKDYLFTCYLGSLILLCRSFFHICLINFYYYYFVDYFVDYFVKQIYYLVMEIYYFVDYFVIEIYYFINQIHLLDNVFNYHMAFFVVI